MKIEILYFEGCANHRPVIERVQRILCDESISAEISEIEIRDEIAAQAAGFVGSPTIRVNGHDIDPDSHASKYSGFACRYYPGGLPPEEMIRAALREAQGLTR
jgi:hypothetical protein